jgi:hypothetical protein
MKRTVTVFGLISGGLLALMMLVGVALVDTAGFENGMLIGYSTMILAGIIMIVGVKSYRDKVNNGVISFGKALKLALLITLISTLMYVAVWMIVSYTVWPDFMDKYADAMLEKMKASGANADQMAAATKEMEGAKEMYKNPLMRALMTFIEPLPVGIPMSLIAALVLRRKPGTAQVAG